MNSEKSILKELDRKYPKSLYWTIWQKPSQKSLKVSVKKKKGVSTSKNFKEKNQTYKKPRFTKLHKSD